MARLASKSALTFGSTKQIQLLFGVLLLCVACYVLWTIAFGGLFSTTPPLVAEFHKAAQSGDDHAVASMLREHPDAATWKNKDGVTALMSASQMGHFSVVAKLVEAGADVNAREPVVGITALRLAASRNQLRVVQYLVDHGADVNMADNHAYTPLMVAAIGGHEDSAKYLLKKGANTLLKDTLLKMNAIELARTRGHNSLADAIQKVASQQEQEQS